MHLNTRSVYLSNKCNSISCIKRKRRESNENRMTYTHTYSIIIRRRRRHHRWLPPSYGWSMRSEPNHHHLWLFLSRPLKVCDEQAMLLIFHITSQHTKYIRHKAIASWDRALGLQTHSLLHILYVSIAAPF